MMAVPATAIQAYNTCKADLANGTAGHGADDHAAELARLQAENAVLKARLDNVRRRLLGLRRSQAGAWRSSS